MEQKGMPVSLTQSCGGSILQLMPCSKLPILCRDCHVGVLLESEVDLPIRKTYGSIIFDGLGVLTAGSLFELAKSVTPLIDTASGL